jgi:hypothetical protein
MLDLRDSRRTQDGDFVIDDLAVHFGRLTSFPAITVKARGNALSVVRGIGTTLALMRLGKTHARGVFDERDAETTALLDARGIQSVGVTLEDLEAPDSPIAVSVRFTRAPRGSEVTRVSETVARSLEGRLEGPIDVDGEWLLFTTWVDSRDPHGGVALAVCLVQLTRDVVPIATYNGHLFQALESVLVPPSASDDELR